MASCHDQFLDRLLPHANDGVIKAAQRELAADVNWDSADSLDFERKQPGRSQASRSKTDRSTHSRRSSLVIQDTRFDDFDGSLDSQIVEAKEQSHPRRMESRGPSEASSLEITDKDLRANMQSPADRRARRTTVSGAADTPPRLSSRADTHGNGHVSNGKSHRNGDGFPSKVNPSLVDFHGTINRDRHAHLSPLSDEEDEDTGLDTPIAVLENKTDRYDQIPRTSSGRPPSPTSATPPPIGKPGGRRVVYDDFDEEDEDEDMMYTAKSRSQTGGTRGHEEAHDQYDESPREARPIKRADGGRRPSMTSNSSKYSHSRPAAHSRTAALTTNYRDLRTPVLDHSQLMRDDDHRPMLPLSKMGAERYASRRPHPKGYRSHDDGLYDDFESGNGSALGMPDNRPAVPMLRRAASDESISVRRSISVSGSTSKQTAPSSVHSQPHSHFQTHLATMPDFLGNGIFQVVLHNPTTAFQLLKFSESRLCAENVEFLTKVDEYRTTLDSLASQLAGIHKNFIAPGSPNQIDVNGTMLRTVHTEMKSLIGTAFPSMETLFSDVQEQVETIVFQDVYPRFVRYQLALSATKALANDRFKYQGLGDCFCLTNPNIADNPIVSASDGFVKVTGYTRPEIVPRNCRFLQGAQSDRVSVRRLKNAIAENKESVELLLNYKKNGSPFWNLLYVAPLYNQRGEVDFFIGGQVNCSTTIHSNADVMKVLSASSATEAEENAKKMEPAGPPPVQQPSVRRTLLRALGVRHHDQPYVPLGDAGMEKGVLGRMEGQNLDAQMKEFYTAYSKYLVVRASTFIIEYYSDGISEMLNPANMSTTGGMIAGSDVFRFFRQNMLNSQNDYKVRVRNAVRAGVPVSTEIRLQTRRSAVFRGDERFAAHWTPLKDEKAAVQWIVVTLAPTMI